MKQAIISSPIGKIYLQATGKDLTWLGFQSPKQGNKNIKRDQPSPSEVTLLNNVTKQLTRYFRGDSKALGRLPITLHGTSFEQKVWKEMRKIPPGSPITYGELARRVGKPRAARAVGGACKKNPLCLVVPCHRVIASSGTLGGYSAGLPRKEFLLTLEKGKPKSTAKPTTKPKAKSVRL